MIPNKHSLNKAKNDVIGKVKCSLRISIGKKTEISLFFLQTWMQELGREKEECMPIKSMCEKKTHERNRTFLNISV